eukprot:2515463-Amphidinium_carterae.1
MGTALSRSRIHPHQRAAPPATNAPHFSGWEIPWNENIQLDRLLRAGALFCQNEWRNLSTLAPTKTKRLKRYESKSLQVQPWEGQGAGGESTLCVRMQHKNVDIGTMLTLSDFYLAMGSS